MSGVSRESPFARHRFGSAAGAGTQELIGTLVLEITVLDPRGVDVGVFLSGEALDGGQHLLGDPAQGTGLGFAPLQVGEVKRFTTTTGRRTQGMPRNPLTVWVPIRPTGSTGAPDASTMRAIPVLPL